MVPKEHWNDLMCLDLHNVCNNSGADLWQPKGLKFAFLNETIFMDLESESLYRDATGERDKIDDPLFELIALVYILNASGVSPSEEMIGVKELKDAHFFQGPHALDFSALTARYGNDLQAFDSVARQLQGVPVEFADAAYRFKTFPKIPIYYLLWAGDEEFQPNISVLFDRSIERHLSADGIWGLVKLVNDKLIKSDGAP
jgi:hypothetical protein